MLLYLLERKFDDLAGSVMIGGFHWQIVAQALDATDAEDTVDFTCISYSWGTGREANPFQPNVEISDRTIPALVTTAAHRPSRTWFWIDAFCVPLEKQERTRSLESMGYIYSQAQEVIAVLSSGSRSAMEQMKASGRVDAPHLHDLESDGWVSRAWTYQEAVNSQVLYITCEGAEKLLVAGNEFLNALGYSLSRLEGSDFDKGRRFPRIDALGELIADYIFADYQQRSALSVMSNMDRRTQSKPEDHFYAMIGAISTATPSSFDIQDPCDLFMSLCERKGDYSFIYSAVERDNAPSRRWRPVRSQDLPSILPWYNYGEGQPGHEAGGSLYLDRMMLQEVSPIGELGRSYVEDKLASTGFRLPGSQVPIRESISTALQSMGFKGSSQGISTKLGFFFPSDPVSADQVTLVLVATEVRFSFGSPGLARISQNNTESYTAGVFFGRVDKSTATSVKIS